MTGLPHYNYHSFDKMERTLLRLGHEVVNPAEIGRQIAGSAHLSDEQLRQIMHDNLAALTTCDAIVLLDGHAMSNGARIEVALARYLGLALITQAMIEHGNITPTMEEAS